MKKAFIWLIVIVLIIVGSVWGALMYLTNEVTKTNTMTMGNVGIELLEFERENIETSGDAAKVQNFHDGKWLLPAITASDFTYTAGDTCVKWDKDKDGNTIKPGYTSPIWDPAGINNEIDKMVFVKNTGKREAYVRVFFAFEAGNYTDFDDFRNNIHLNLNDDDWTWEWIKFIGESDDANYFVAKATYQKKLAPGAITEISLSQIALDSAAENDDVAAFDGKYDVKVYAQGIQSEGFDTAAQALTEGFGRGIPFKDIYIEGNTMYNALRYLDGDTEGENITNKVTSITFGLNNAYPQIADNYQGTPINDEQDYYVNVHYVPKGENYNLYVLADGPIYTPVDSTNLFRNMQFMETIDTTNLNTSRTKNMTYMFLYCYKLETLDLSAWNVQNVEIMMGMFYYCTALQNLNISNWNTENLTDLDSFFNRCYSLKEVDISSLDTAKVTRMSQMFEFCESLERIIGLDKLNTSSVKDMQQMFNCYTDKAIKLTEIDLSAFDSSSLTCTSYMFSGCIHLKTVHFGKDWDMAEVSNTNNMFNGCTSLQNINIATEWKTDNLTEAAAMFSGCSSLTTAALTTLGVPNWKTDKVTKMSSMFSGCSSLTTLDLSGWNTANVTHMDSMFNNCLSLTTLDVLGWKTDKVNYMSSMFNGCVGLTALDLSSWNTNKISKSEKMFAGCSNLVTISVGDGWNLPSAASSADMFKDCTKLVGGNGTVFNSAIVDKTYAIIDTPDAPGYLTYKPSDSTNP